MIVALLVGLSGMLGALFRFSTDRWFEARRARRRPEVPSQTPFPAGTLVVNVAGSLLIGLAAGGLGMSNPDVYPVLAAGLAGGLTTFSTFTVAAVALWRDRRPGAAVVHVITNAGCGLGAAWLGLMLTGPA